MCCLYAELQTESADRAGVAPILFGRLEALESMDEINHACRYLLESFMHKLFSKSRPNDHRKR